MQLKTREKCYGPFKENHLSVFPFFVNFSANSQDDLIILNLKCKFVGYFNILQIE